MTWEIVAGLVGILSLIGAAWWRMEGKIDDVGKSQTAMLAAFNDFRVNAAEKYATKEELREVEEEAKPFRRAPARARSTN